jgi:putative membrane protein
MKTKLALARSMATLALTCVLAPMAQAEVEVNLNPPRSIVAEIDSVWLMKSAQGSLMEIAVSQIALQKAAGNPAVTEYANMLISHHQTSYNELRALAERKRMAFPGEMNSDQMLLVSYFQNSTSADWAKDFVQFQIQNHEKCIAETRDVIANGRDASVKEEASKMLPILETHLRMAQELLTRM